MVFDKLTGDVLLDADSQTLKFREIAATITGMVESAEDTVLLGIRTRGAAMARRLQRMIATEYGHDLAVGDLDISLYRDDLSRVAENPVVKNSNISFEVAGRQVLLIDDVLYTGRTIRSAIDAILDQGRPTVIRLIVLVDRGGRELPIQADYAALTLDVAEGEVIKVCLDETDGVEQTLLARISDLK
jgi:pyrimidine operon attenuation protein/uracil phosphoribosyltransferase